MESVQDWSRSLRRWRAGFFGLLALFIAVILVGAYALLDQGVSYTYLSDELQYVTDDFAIVRRVAPTLREGDTRPDVLALLRRQNPQAIISSTDSTVTIGALVFRFEDDGRLTAIDRPES